MNAIAAHADAPAKPIENINAELVLCMAREMHRKPYLANNVVSGAAIWPPELVDGESYLEAVERLKYEAADKLVDLADARAFFPVNSHRMIDLRAAFMALEWIEADAIEAAKAADDADENRTGSGPSMRLAAAWEGVRR